MTMIFFNIHNIFRFSITGAIPREMEKFFAQEMGYFQCEETPVDLEIEILPEIADPPVSFASRYGKDGQYFYVRDPYSRKVGIFSRSKVIAEAQVNSGWLLKDIIEPFFMLHALPRGYTFLHASAVEKDGKSFIFTALPGTGKTNFLIGLLGDGYSFLADELVILSKDGTAYPYPRPLSVYPYNIQAHPRLLEVVAGKSFWRRQQVKLLFPLYRAQALPFIKHPTSLFLRVCQMVLRKIAYRNFPVDFQALGTTIGKSSQIEKVFLVTGDNSISEPQLAQVEDKRVFASQLWANVFAEKSHFFMEIVLACRFGFPGKALLLEEENVKLGEEVMLGALEHAQCFRLTIPKKAAFQEVFEQCKKYL